MNAALASYAPTLRPPSLAPRPTARLARSSSRGAPRARSGKYATQLEALANAHTQVDAAQ